MENYDEFFSKDNTLQEMRYKRLLAAIACEFPEFTQDVKDMLKQKYNLD